MVQPEQVIVEVQVQDGGNANGVGGDGSPDGGKGGDGSYGSGNGAGNPNGTNGKSLAAGNGTGGLLIVYCKDLNNINTISSNGLEGSSALSYGGNGGRFWRRKR